MNNDKLESSVIKLAIENEKDTLKTISSILLIHRDYRRKLKEELSYHLQKYLNYNDNRVDYHSLMLPLGFKDINEYKKRVKEMEQRAKGNYYVEHWLNKAKRKKPKNRLQAILFYISFSLTFFSQEWLELSEWLLDGIAEKTFDHYLTIHGESAVTPSPHIMDTEWNDGYSSKSVKDRIIDNNDKVIMVIALMLEREMIINPTINDLNKIIDKRLNVQENDIRRHMETYSTLATNKGLLLAYAHLGKCLKHISVLDNRTTDLCRSRDGVIFPVSEAVFGVTIPPLHYRCRSIVVEVEC